jgi:hypothetical protein
VALKIGRIEHPNRPKDEISTYRGKRRPFDKAKNKRKEEEHGTWKIFKDDNFIFVLMVIVGIGLRA